MKRFILWGRSMGAASAIKYCEHINESIPQDFKRDIVGVILDSCFKSFSTLAV
jgi:pimeloyl-ACP methyl ester carboxylesterase